MATAIEQAAEVIVITDADAVIRYVNPAFTKVAGYTREEAIGRNPRIFSSGRQDEAFYHGLWNTLTAGQTWRGRFVNRRKDGTLYTEDASISPVRDATGATVSYVAVKHDITRELDLETQLLQAQKLESIGTLAGGVAHEINNPIMGIMNYAQLILDRVGPDSPVAGFASDIGKETARIAAIVKSLLSFARQDKESHRSPARLCDIVANALSLVRAVMRHDQIALEVDVPADLPPIRCRSQQIQQVIMNLLTNARDALNQRYPGHDENKKILISAGAVADRGSRIEGSGKAAGNVSSQSAIRNPQSVGCASPSRTMERASRKTCARASSTRSSRRSRATREPDWDFPSATASSPRRRIEHGEHGGRVRPLPSRSAR